MSAATRSGPVCCRTGIEKALSSNGSGWRNEKRIKPDGTTGGNTTQQIDFLLTPPNATPAVQHDGMKDAVSSCGYTFLFNLVRKNNTPPQSQKEKKAEKGHESSITPAASSPSRTSTSTWIGCHQPSLSTSSTAWRRALTNITTPRPCTPCRLRSRWSVNDSRKKRCWRL